MEVIPALDLVGEDAVRLYQGDFARPIWRRPAVEHLDDLDGARTGVVRVELLRRLMDRAESMRVQVAGGIRSTGAARSMIDAGADRVIIGTAAFAGADALREFVDEIGPRLVVAIDVRGGYVTVRGWQTETRLGVDQAVQHCCDAGVARFLCTAVDRDGTLAGPDLELLRTVVPAGVPVMAAGGVRSQQDVDDLSAIGCEAASVGTPLGSHPEAPLAAPRSFRCSSYPRASASLECWWPPSSQVAHRVDPTCCWARWVGSSAGPASRCCIARLRPAPWRWSHPSPAWWRPPCPWPLESGPASGPPSCSCWASRSRASLWRCSAGGSRGRAPGCAEPPC